MILWHRGLDYNTGAQQGKDALPSSQLRSVTPAPASFSNSLPIWQMQTTPSPLYQIYMQVRKQQLELDMEQQTGSR